MGEWCSGSTSTSHVEGQEFDSLRLQSDVEGALLAQLVAHRSDKAKVNSSILLESIILPRVCTRR